jgi:hypothetical protein
MPQAALRRLYDAIDLHIRYQPGDRAVDIEITLTSGIGDISALAPPDDRVGPASQVCSVHPTCHRSNLNLQVTGPVVSAGPRHGKVRRDGYRKSGT